MVAVTFVNPTTDQRLEVGELDELMTVQEAVENLVERGLIREAENGAHYTLDIKGKTRLSRNDATLASGGVANGDVISVVRVQQGGR
jgi:predicted transcriptional regulator